MLLNKATKMTSSELSRQTPDCIGVKLLIASTVLVAYRNRNLGTLMRCCEAWKPIEDCFDTSPLESIDFQSAKSLGTLHVKLLRNVRLIRKFGLRSHSLVILDLMYSATKVFTILHDAPSGTIARGVHLFFKVRHSTPDGNDTTPASAHACASQCLPCRSW